MSQSGGGPAPLTSILYDARTIGPGMSGVGRYTLNLLTALAARPAAPPIRALFRKETIALAQGDPALSGVELLEAPYSHEAHPQGDLWLRWGLPKLVRPGELYFGPAFLIPGGRCRFPRVVMIHDLFVFTHPRYFSLTFRHWMRRTIRQACRLADRVIVPTKTVRGQLIEGGFASGGKIRPIAEAPDATGAVWDNAAQKGVKGLERLIHDRRRPKILTVGTVDPRKDPATARAAHVRLAELLKADASDKGHPVDWIWIGGPGTVEDDTPAALKRQAAALGFENVGHLPGAAVRPALEAAAAYVTCSRTEGFGIPLVEAMAAGRPVVASDIPVHREVAGDAALYFPPGDPAALARILARLLKERELGEALAGRSRARATQFSWARAAELTLKTFHEAARV